MDLDGLCTAAGAAAPSGAPTHGPAADDLLEGAEYDTETEDAAGASEVAARGGASAAAKTSGLGSGSSSGSSSGNSSGSSGGSTVAYEGDSKNTHDHRGRQQKEQQAAAKVLVVAAARVRPPTPAGWGGLATEDGPGAAIEAITSCI